MRQGWFPRNIWFFGDSLMDGLYASASGGYHRGYTHQTKALLERLWPGQQVTIANQGGQDGTPLRSLIVALKAKTAPWPDAIVIQDAALHGSSFYRATPGTATCSVTVDGNGAVTATSDIVDVDGSYVDGEGVYLEQGTHIGAEGVVTVAGGLVTAITPGVHSGAAGSGYNDIESCTIRKNAWFNQVCEGVDWILANVKDANGNSPPIFVISGWQESGQAAFWEMGAALDGGLVYGGVTYATAYEALAAGLAALYPNKVWLVDSSGWATGIVGLNRLACTATYDIVGDAWTVAFAEGVSLPSATFPTDGFRLIVKDGAEDLHSAKIVSLTAGELVITDKSVSFATTLETEDASFTAWIGHDTGWYGAGTFGDNYHPSDFGHYLLASMLVRAMDSAMNSVASGTARTSGARVLVARTGAVARTGLAARSSSTPVPDAPDPIQAPVGAFSYESRIIPLP